MEFNTKKWEKEVTKYLNWQSDKEFFLRWAIEEKVKKCVDGITSFERLVIKKGSVGDQTISPMPFSDHIGIYERIDGTRLMISQPYLNKKVSAEIIMESDIMKDWLEERGLKISLISEKLSWHVPGSTILIQVEVADEEKCIEVAKQKIKNFHQWLKLN